MINDHPPHLPLRSTCIPHSHHRPVQHDWSIDHCCRDTDDLFLCKDEPRTFFLKTFSENTDFLVRPHFWTRNFQSVFALAMSDIVSDSFELLDTFTDLWLFITIWTVAGCASVYLVAGVVVSRVAIRSGSSKFLYSWVPPCCALLGSVLGLFSGAISGEILCFRLSANG